VVGQEGGGKNIEMWRAHLIERGISQRGQSTIENILYVFSYLGKSSCPQNSLKQEGRSLRRQRGGESLKRVE